MTSKKIIVATYQILTLVMMLVALYAIFLYAPIDKNLGIIQKIFYIHLPSAFLAFIAFFITFLASILYLYKRDSKWDVMAYCSVEVGVLFASIVLITGPLWARPIWNVWWTWDPRLTTTLILWFVYVAYLMFRGVVDENHRANFSAVFGIIGFVNVPLTFFSIRLWRTIHPVLITSKGINISTPMKQTLIITFIAFCLLFLYLLMYRIRLEKMRINVEKIKDFIQDKYHYE